jgi:hypothetical protein
MVLDTLFLLALAVWLGGIFTLWIAALPPAEKVSSLQHLSGFIEFGGILMVAVQFLMRRRYQSVRLLFITDGARQLLTFAALLLAEMCRYNLFPVMESSLSSGKMEDYTRLARLSTLLTAGQIIFLLGVVIATTLLSSPPTASTPGAKITGEPPRQS